MEVGLAVAKQAIADFAKKVEIGEGKKVEMGDLKIKDNEVGGLQRPVFTEMEYSPNLSLASNSDKGPDPYEVYEVLWRLNEKPYNLLVKPKSPQNKAMALVSLSSLSPPRFLGDCSHGVYRDLYSVALLLFQSTRAEKLNT